MIPVLGIFLAAYVLTIGIILIAGIFRADQDSDDLPKIKPDELTLIIPFRNEEKRIGAILDCLNRQKSLPAGIIFVDDHSEDESAAVIRNNAANLPFLYLGLPDGKFGKKEAIRHAMASVTTEFVLTMDADVAFGYNYFNNLELLSRADMWILPVHMKGNNLKERWFALDHFVVNAINKGVTRLFRPIMASGANLLFRTKSYWEVSMDDHLVISSGDDMFLLRDFRNAGLDIRFCDDRNLAVTVRSPSDFNEMLDQRVRWISKTRKVGDLLSTTLAALQFLFAVGFGVLVVWSGINELWTMLLFIEIKIALDTLLMSPYFLKKGAVKELFLFPLYDLIYPLYAVLIALTSLVYSPQWKGRKVKV